MTNVAIIYYSASGTNHAIAVAVAEGVRTSGGEARLRLVQETLPSSVVNGNEHWKKFADSVADAPRASHEDVLWADAIVFGTPTRFGNVSSQLKTFIDGLGGLWFQGKLANKVYAGFTSAQNPNGGQESTLLALYNSFYHFGGYIVTPGYTDPAVFAAGGNPYGVSVTAAGQGPTEQDITHARYLGRRVTEVATRLKG
ncbi:MAG: NAD(P)H:quinone oxidoreductase [Myxococcales bacterium]|nr:NAD(P)H:quinone oxidoreductase [Polyangiaceae bacterium]MDW8250152.1 NAD(P)H:quinone oxidoreductase [Myxococcales bacterium]